MKIQKLMALGLCLGLSLSVTNAIADGKAQAKEHCGNCHGADGNSNDPKVPNIAGFSVTTFLDIAESYRDGSRHADKYTPKVGDANDMSTIMRSMGDPSLQVIAEFYASQPFKRHPQKTDPAKVAAGAKLHEKNCEKCHSESGSLADDDAGILAGQWRPYLQDQFTKFSSEKRGMPKKMKKKFSPLTEEEKAALLDFYASQK
ncbi:MAG: Cytochrome c, class I [uncultured Thiotrichaceae bacterium]|uniref:Cytochrome c, class I n=1 Tax=uncultured Thiotrichaceae bacterium TaxID=298394 RepID=A0A6S6TYS7_9GAMM|nr:MAG: Cytochrome c, class I [uncultured Thiotrichaceae bacterium]